MRTAIVVCIGDELLIGQTLDTNSAWIAQQLSELGIDVVRKMTISDKASAIRWALDQSIGQADLVIMTGGLGPTRDDITKLALADYFGAKMVRNTIVHQHVQQFFAMRNRPMLAVNDQQADVPDNCEILFNSKGTAPGMLFQKNDTWIVSLPGVPSEMKTIISEELLPRILSAKQDNSCTIHKYLLLFGRGESFIADDIADIEHSMPAYIKLAYLPDHSSIKLRLSGKGNEKCTLSEEMNQYWNQIKERVQEYIVAEEDTSMEAAVVQMLKKHQLTISTAESCTGGMIGSKITDIPGASAVYMGSIVSYDNKIKNAVLKVPEQVLSTVGAVSEETVRQMAEEVRNLMGTDISVSVSGILGPDGGTASKPVGLVYFGIATPKGVTAYKRNFHQNRLINKEQVVKTALNFIRLAVLKEWEH